MAGDWQEVSFSQLCDITRGASPRPIHEWIADEGIPWVKISDANAAQSRFITSTSERIKSEGRHRSVEVHPGDLILSNSATPGIPKFMGIDACIHDGWLLLRNLRNLDKSFAYYLLLHERPRLVEQGNGSVFTNLKTDILKNHRIQLPPLPEQRAIAHILGTLDDKIELNLRMNETLEAMARALFKSWFVGFDPVRATAEGRDHGVPKPLADLFPDSFEDSALGEIPKGWKVRGLDEIGRFLNGLALQKYPAGEGEWLPVIKIAQLRAGHTNGADRASANLPPDYVVNDGDVLFSWSGSLECVLWAGGKGALNQHLFKVTSTEFPKWFPYLWIGEHLPGFRSIAAAKATTMGHIQRHHLSEAKAVIPPRDFLIAADQHLRPLIDAITRHLVQCKSLGALRDELLPKLITGDVRIKDAARFVGQTV